MDVAEKIISQVQASQRIRCPKCSKERKKSHEKTLSITVFPDRNVYDCHHCGWSGAVRVDEPLRKYRDQVRQKVRPISTQLKQDADSVTQFFRQRGIDLSGASTPEMTIGTKFFPSLNKKTPAIGFVYGPRSQPEAIKWRPLDGSKHFVQDGSAGSFYGLERVPEGAEELIIVEGEADAVALASIGVVALSCPNGAPSKVSKRGIIDPEEDTKFSYVWEARELLQKAKKVIIAVDQDEPGEALAEELARRIGRAKCYRTKYPDGIKDPNDMIRVSGAEGMKVALDKSEPFPLSGVYSPSQYMGQLLEVYREGLPPGLSTGYRDVDKLFTIKEGQLYIVTGLPSSGKSEFIDQLMINTGMSDSWKWGIASFENPPAMHMTKLAEKLVQKPFGQGPTPRMTREELEGAVGFMQQHFAFLENRDGSMPTARSILDRAKQAVMRLGIRGLVIDPYNYIDLGKDKDNEHTAISVMLSEINQFAKAYNVAVFFVAHPAKIYPREDGTMPVPKGMHISGSAAWFAKADFGLTVHRGDHGVEIHCWKVRHKWLGEIGMTRLGYNALTGVYMDAPDLGPISRQGLPPTSKADPYGDWEL